MTNYEKGAWSILRPPVPTGEEVHQIVQNAPGAMWAALFSTAAKKGLRGAELRALKWQDIDRAKGLIRITTKSCARFQLVSMTPEEFRVLDNVTKELRDPEGFVFCIKPGVPLSPVAVTNALNAAQRAAGILDSSGRPKFLVHSLRLHFREEIVRRGVSDNEFAILMGTQPPIPKWE